MRPTKFTEKLQKRGRGDGALWFDKEELRGFTVLAGGSGVLRPCLVGAAPPLPAMPLISHQYFISNSRDKRFPNNSNNGTLIKFLKPLKEINV